MKKLITMSAVLFAVLGTYAQNMGASAAQKRVLDAEKPVADQPAEAAPVEEVAPAPEAIDSVELGVIKKYAGPILENVTERAPEYAEARMLLKFLAYFKEFPDDEIPPTSILREFLSGSSFKY